MIGLSELRAQGWKYGCLAAIAGLLLALSAGGVQTLRLSHAQTALAQAATEKAEAAAQVATARALASESARVEEQSRAAAVNAVANAYERGKTDAQAVADRVAGELRSGTVRLRAEIRALAARGVPSSPGAAGEPADAAERGESLIGSAVGVGKACDLRIDALIRAYDAANAQHASRPGH